VSGLGVPASIDDFEIRNNISAAGLAVTSLGSTGPEERQRAYETWLFPLKDDALFERSMADAMYSCALNALACLRSSGVEAPEFFEPYHTHIGAAPAWLMSIARRCGAYVDLSTAKAVASAPEIRWGSVLCVEGPYHAIVVCERDDDALRPPDAFAVFTTSEGGMPEVSASGEHGMRIHSRRMALRTQGGRIQTGTLNVDGTVTWGRLATWAIDPMYLVTRDP
jgi:hypothetical protein